MNFEKRKKISKTVRKIMNDILSKELSDNDNIFWIINISDIILSPDASYLDLKVSSFQNQELLTKTLAKYAHNLQRRIGKELQMRISPRVRFRYDNTWEVWQEVISQINEIDISHMEKRLEQ